jgi:hypothetical protein
LRAVEALGVERLIASTARATIASRRRAARSGQDVVRERASVAALGPADADAKAEKLLRAKMLRDRAQPVVSGGRRPGAPESSEVEVALVVHDEHGIGSTLKNFAAAATERPDSFMYVSGLSRATR